MFIQFIRYYCIYFVFLAMYMHTYNDICIIICEH